jgi:hypothetical protein
MIGRTVTKCALRGIHYMGLMGHLISSLELNIVSLCCWVASLRTYQLVFAYINLDEKLWKELRKPSIFTCFDLCRGCCKW